MREFEFGDWVVVWTAARFVESKRVLVESKTKCGRLFLRLWWLTWWNLAPNSRAFVVKIHFNFKGDSLCRVRLNILTSKLVADVRI